MIAKYSFKLPNSYCLLGTIIASCDPPVTMRVKWEDFYHFKAEENEALRN